MEVAEGLPSPVVPPHEERRTADVVPEHELGDGVAEGERRHELSSGEVFADDKAVDGDAFGLDPGDPVRVQPLTCARGIHVCSVHCHSWPSIHASDRPVNSARWANLPTANSFPSSRSWPSTVLPQNTLTSAWRVPCSS